MPHAGPTVKRGWVERRQREVLRTLRVRDQAQAQARLAAARAAVDAARARYEALDALVAGSAPPAAGRAGAVIDERRRRERLAHLKRAQDAALADLDEARRALATAQAALAERAGAVKAIDVLDARAADEVRRRQARQDERDADERNRGGA